MNEQTAEWILYAITAVAAVAWLAGLRFLIASAAARKLAARSAAEHMDLHEPISDNLIYGAAEVPGQPDELSARAAAVLASGQTSNLGLIKIVERTADRLTFEQAGPSDGGRCGRSPVLHGQFRFTAQGSDRTRIDYAASLAAGRGLLVAGVIVQFLGLAAIIIGFVLIRTLVVPNPNLAVRGQVFQMLQVVHFLWPSFLFGGLFRLRDRWVRAAFDTLVHNLPHLKG
jgi:hypothetical protein